MKQRILSKIMMIVIFIFSTISIFAQENQTTPKPTFKRHEFNVSVGVFPIPLNPYNLVFEDFYFSGYFFGLVNKHEYTSYSIPFSLNCSYHYKLSPKYSLGINAVYSLKKTRDVLSTIYGTNIHVFSLFVSNKFTYFNNEKASLYSTVAVGFNYTNELGFRESFSFKRGTNYFFPDIHICLLGLSLGKSKILNMEIGYGSQGIFKVGVNF